MQVTQLQSPVSASGDPEGTSARPILEAIVEASREAVLIADSSLRIVVCNENARRSFARENLELPGKRLSEVFRDIALHEAFRKAVGSGGPSDIRIEISAAERRVYDVHVASLGIGRELFAVGMFYDITQIERLERVRQEFLSNISHELRTPLTSILAFVETLEDGAIDDRENNRRFLSTIRRNAERMHALIADILELSLIESGNISIEVKQVRVGHLVDEVFAALSSKAAERQIRLVNTIGTDDRVNADPMRLEQMLTNLIDNAIKFNRSEGSVTVRLEHHPEKDVVAVEDSGEGILAGHVDRIFERFYRVDRGRTREVGGTGLGLAIVKHLARLHGGEIAVSSTLGSGTAFYIELPKV